MLKEKLQNDIKEALKAGNAEKRMVLSLVMSSVKSKELDKRAKFSKSTEGDSELEEKSKLTDEEVIEVISSEIKKRKDSIEQYEKGGRPELAEKEKSEMDILMGYMPEQMPEDELKKVIAEVIKDSGASGPKDMGKVIGAVMAKVKGKAEGTLVSKLIKEALGN